MTHQSVLITGISGGLAQLAMKILSDRYEGIFILGIDNRPLPLLRESKQFKMQRIPYTRNHFERLFRDHKFDLVLNLGRFSYSLLNAPRTMAQKLEFSVVETRRILDLSLRNGVKKIVGLSTFHVYGALPSNPAYLNEDMPLRALLKHWDLRHVVEMDNVVCNWMWRHQNDIECVLFRPCSIVGTKIRNTISRYLAYRYSPYPIDFNPMLQFIHEFDMAHLIVHACERLSTGVYNAAPDEVIPLRQALKIANGGKGIPIPFAVGKALARLVESPILRVPDYLIDYLMHPCLIDNSALKKHLPQDFFRFAVEDSLQTLRAH